MKNKTAIILAGGKSSRMGEDKSLLPINGKPMIAHIVEQLAPIFDNLIISGNDPEKYKFLNLPIVPDKEIGAGPLMGILSCLQKSKSELNFITACDIPQLDMGFIKKMVQIAEKRGADIVVPVTGKDRYEPLFAVYRRSVIPHAEKVLESGKRRIIALFDHLNVEFIKMSENNWYKNVNTMNEYCKIKNIDAGDSS